MEEFDFRHPGTSYDSDDEELRGDNDVFSPINTKAAQRLYAIAFAAGDAQASGAATPTHTVLRAAYKLQLSVRVDDKRRALNFDCFEYKPTVVDPERQDSLPTLRSIERFDACTGMGDGGRDRGFGMDSDDSDDDDDPALDEPVRHRDGGSFDQPTRMGLLFRGTVGDFLSSRLLRFRVPLASVVGARLVASLEDVEEGDQEEDRVSAALVLELDAPAAAPKRLRPAR